MFERTASTSGTPAIMVAEKKRHIEKTLVVSRECRFESRATKLANRCLASLVA
jgi:hypothetical protein